MIINGKNRVQGLYNYNTAPEGVIFTKDDIVLNDNILYTCLVDTPSEPDIIDVNWDYYLNSLSPVQNLTDLSLPENSGRLVSANGVREFLQNSLPGVNSDGSLKVLANGSLDEISINSKFQLDPKYLIDLKAANAASIPFTPSLDELYIISTLGNFTGANLVNQTLFHQEILVITSTGNTSHWYRSGASLNTSSWRTLDITTHIQEYVDYLIGLADKNLEQANLYEDFLTDITLGEYKIWKEIPEDKVNLISGKLTFTDTATPFQSEYKKDKHYRVYLGIESEGLKYSDSIDVTPDDHSYLDVGEYLEYKRIPDLQLSRVQSSTSELILPAGVTIIGMKVSNTFSL
jgi:hypothetical protein